MDTRNSYEFIGVRMYDSGAQEWRVRDFNLTTVRVLYALQDMPVEHGALCVVPGSHKANYFSPYADDQPTAEPGMLPIPMAAGDAIIFTENLRHGGFPNLLKHPRKTLHLTFAPRWAGSQSPVHWNDKVYVSAQAWERYSEAQRALLPPPPGEFERQVKFLIEDNLKLKTEIDRLKAENKRVNMAEVAHTSMLESPRRGFVSALRRVIGA